MISKMYKKSLFSVVKTLQNQTCSFCQKRWTVACAKIHGPSPLNGDLIEVNRA